MGSVPHTQEDEILGRRLSCTIRSVLVSAQDAIAFLDHLSRQDPSWEWIPQKPHVTYTFAGEIPWCDTFPKSGPSEFSFVTEEESVTVKRIQSEFYLDGERLELTPIELHLRKTYGSIPRPEGQQHISDEDLERIEVREVPVEVEEVQKKYAEFNALIPVCDFGWEGYQTMSSKPGHATLLAKEVASDLELIGQPQSFDLFTQGGVKATINISDQGTDFNNRQSMLFIREELLQAYLKKNDLVLIWAIWGLREYSSAYADEVFKGPDPPELTPTPFGIVKRYE